MGWVNKLYLLTCLIKTNIYKICVINPWLYDSNKRSHLSTGLSTKCKKKEKSQYIRVSHWSPVHPSSQPSVQILTKLQLLLAQLFGQYSLQEGPRQSRKNTKWWNIYKQHILQNVIIVRELCWKRVCVVIQFCRNIFLLRNEMFCYN